LFNQSKHATMAKLSYIGIMFGGSTVTKLIPIDSSRDFLKISLTGKTMKFLLHTYDGENLHKARSEHY